MAILASDIKLLESERMRDTADGGGRMTGRVIPSGQAGNVFPKVSRVDSVYGRVNLRKIYVAVRTATLDMYAGAHAIITDAPNNDRISCVLFSTGSSFDTRAAARDRIESYVVAGPLSRMRLYGNQLVGQKAILCYQREEEPLPEVGSVLVLSVEASGYAATVQFVRITDIEHDVRVLTNANNVDYRRRILTMKISTALGQTFTGAEPSPFSQDLSPTKVRITQVADASKYYGIQALAEPALAGELTVRINSIYAPLVPSTERETPVSMAMVTGVARAVAAATSTITLPPSNHANVSLPWSINVGHAITPGSVVLTYPTSRVATDDGQGKLIGAPRLFAVDYDGGVIAYVNGGDVQSIDYTVTYLPAAVAANAAHTRSIPITLGTRGTVYAKTLNPLPEPGSLIVDFRALGRWYRLRDNGAGVLVANTLAEGTGSIDYATGAVVITLGALPDVDSAVLLAWGSPVHYAIRTADAASAAVAEYVLEHRPVVPGSVTISYPVGGVVRTATDAAANGTVSGTGVSGTINYATGAVRLSFTVLPDHQAALSNAYTWRDGDVMSGATGVLSGGQFTVSGTAPFRNGGTFMLQCAASVGGNISVSAYIASDGTVRASAGKGGTAPRVRWADQPIGTFNAATGVVTLTAPVTLSGYQWDTMFTWSALSATATPTSVSAISVERDTAAFSPTAVTAEAVAVIGVGAKIDLLQTIASPIVPGSVMFSAAGKTYIDRSGTLYADINYTTGSGTPAGSIDYATGVATLTFWADGVSLSRSVKACLTQYGDWTAVDYQFRTAGSPLRPASFYVQVTAEDGELLSATADQNGVISGPAIRGSIEQSMGVVSLEFGTMSGAAWVPRKVAAGSLRYNSVVLSNLPLDPAILGLDPVRLPSDGRVPIYRPADVVVVHHTDTVTIASPVAGATYSAGRTDLAVLRLENAAGSPVSDTRYVANLSAGTVTLAADWTSADGAAPLKLVHRIEQMGLLSDVQINGQISLSAPLVRDFPGGSLVSSALLYGDMQAIVTNLFDQSTWTSVWSDALIGSQATAQYDDINYPVEILNASAVTERWRINFTSATAFQVIGENLGVIATGTTAADLSPINPVTSEPYFVLRAAGWGLGWSAGNQLRFNTVGANGPTWIARTILAGATLEGDSFDVEARGDVDL